MRESVNPNFSRPFVWILIALVAASVLGVGLVVVRVLYSWSLGHCYLVWNLFLAWIPLGFALLAWRFRESRWRLLLCAAAWLLFFPNAPYIMTDLVHLRERPPVPFWFDVVLLQSFVWLGLLLGFVSLYWMQCLVANFVGRRASWLFVLLVIGLTAFGIYLGRFQRWNSWDILANPIGLTVDIFKHLRPPKRRMAGLFSILYATFFFVGYLFLYALTHLPRQALSPADSRDEPKT
jgi:uncharacterized membrane protein